MLMEMRELWANRLHVSICFSKNLKVCVVASMAPVSRFELIGDEYLHAALECREVMLRVGWIRFLQKFSGFNVAVSKAFV